MFSRLNENQLVLFVMDRGHSKSTFVVQGGSLKRELKRTEERGEGRKGGGGGGVSSLSVCSLCEKNCLIFKHQAEFFLITCLAVAKCFLV